MLDDPLLDTHPNPSNSHLFVLPEAISVESVIEPPLKLLLLFVASKNGVLTAVPVKLSHSTAVFFLDAKVALQLVGFAGEVSNRYHI